MTIEFITFNNKVSQLVAEPSDRRFVVSAVIAQLLAESTTLPTGEVENLENFYLMNVKTAIVEKMGYLNEKLTFDVNVAQEYTRKYWMLRYNTVFPINPFKRKINLQYGYFDTIMGVGIFIDDEHHQFVNRYKAEILDLYVDLAELMKG